MYGIYGLKKTATASVHWYQPLSLCVCATLLFYLPAYRTAPPHICHVWERITWPSLKHPRASSLCIFHFIHGTFFSFFRSTFSFSLVESVSLFSRMFVFLFIFFFSFIMCIFSWFCFKTQKRIRHMHVKNEKITLNMSNEIETRPWYICSHTLFIYSHWDVFFRHFLPAAAADAGALIFSVIRQEDRRMEKKRKWTVEQKIESKRKNERTNGWIILMKQRQIDENVGEKWARNPLTFSSEWKRI